jgi:tripartite ATP-independent transporter DctP family solute receptor
MAPAIQTLAERRMFMKDEGRVHGKRIRCIGVFVIAVVFFGCGLAWAADFEIRFGYAPPPGMAPDVTFKKFKEIVEKESKGKIQVSLFGSAQLGGDRAVIEACQSGNLEMACGSTQNWSVFTKAFRVFDLPFMMKSRESAYKILDGEIGKQVIAQFEKETGLKFVIFTEYGGMRHMWQNRKEVRVPADLAGMKIRAVMSPIEMAILRGFGANPTALDWGEVYAALKQKTIDGQGNSLELMYLAKHYEVLPYCTILSYVWSAEPAAINRKFFEKLPKDLQNLVLSAARRAELAGRDYTKEREPWYRKKCEEAGVKFYDPKPEEMKLWINKVVPSVWDQFKKEIGEDNIQRVKNAQ